MTNTSWAAPQGFTGPAILGHMTRAFSFHGRAWHLGRPLCRALLVLALGPLCLEAREVAHMNAFREPEASAR